MSTTYTVLVNLNSANLLDFIMKEELADNTIVKHYAKSLISIG